MDKTKETLKKWCSADGIAFVNEAAKSNYKARAQRIADVIQLNKPDRVPVIPSFSMFPALDNGFTCEEVVFDYDKAAEAWLKTLSDFEPDSFGPPTVVQPGPVLNKLQYQPLKLPGQDVDPNHVFQYAESEFVKAEEFYKAYLSDPSDFMLRTFLARVCGALEPLENLPALTTMLSYSNGLVGGVLPFGNPAVAEALQALIKAGEEAQRFYAHIARVANKIKSLGFPNVYGGISTIPFDVVGDWFRGTRGVMMDMFRYPNELKAVMAHRVPLEIGYGVGLARRTGAPVIGLMLHKGSRTFMSGKQFEEFYWPGLRDVMLGIIEAGFVPMPLFEGDYNTRLETIKDIPKGKAIYWFEHIDIYEAKKVLGDRVCIRGNVPGSMLQIGTAQEVREYVKELIDVFGRDGGLIVDCGMWFDSAKHENVKAMVETTMEYGVL
jgi:uroporphyrinogen-III decarboxylase